MTVNTKRVAGPVTAKKDLRVPSQVPGGKQEESKDQFAKRLMLIVLRANRKERLQSVAKKLYEDIDVALESVSVPTDAIIDSVTVEFTIDSYESGEVTVTLSGLEAAELSLLIDIGSPVLVIGEMVSDGVLKGTSLKVIGADDGAPANRAKSDEAQTEDPAGQKQTDGKAGERPQPQGGPDDAGQASS